MGSVLSVYLSASKIYLYDSWMIRNLNTSNLVHLLIFRMIRIFSYPIMCAVILNRFLILTLSLIVVILTQCSSIMILLFIFIQLFNWRFKNMLSYKNINKLSIYCTICKCVSISVDNGCVNLNLKLMNLYYYYYCTLYK